MQAEAASAVRLTSSATAGIVVPLMAGARSRAPAIRQA